MVLFSVKMRVDFSTPRSTVIQDSVAYHLVRGQASLSSYVTNVLMFLPLYLGSRRCRTSLKKIIIQYSFASDADGDLNFEWFPRSLKNSNNLYLKRPAKGAF